jgi:uncharacterized integral membrane protein
MAHRGDPQRPAETTAERQSWRRYGLIAVAVILLLFMALNSQKVEVNLIIGTAEMPLIFALLIAALLGAIVGWVVPKVRRADR